MTRINDTPLFAEEQTQLIQEEQLSLQEILSQFNYPVPSGFVKLGQPRKYWGSTEGLEKTICERYVFKYDGKSITLDIAQELSNKLELTSKENFHIKEEVLSHSPEEGGITIENEKEIFLEKPFTIQNLERDINKLFELIKKLEGERGENQETITNLKKQLEEKERDKNDWKNEWLKELRKNKSLTKESEDKDYKEHLQEDIKRLVNERKELTERIKKLEYYVEKVSGLVDEEIEEILYPKVD